MSAARTAWVFGGTGAIGQAIVRRMAAQIPTRFTWHRSEAVAQTLAEETGAIAHQIDLRDPVAIADLLTCHPCDVFVHCAAIAEPQKLEAITNQAWDDAHALHCRAPFVALRTLAPYMREVGRGDAVLLGALGGNQSLPLPITFAASQGTLPALVMTLARALAPDGICVNLVVAGVTGVGVSAKLDPQVVQDYQVFSALRRLGKPDDIAQAAVWLALENRAMNGKILPINGGI